MATNVKDRGGGWIFWHLRIASTCKRVLATCRKKGAGSGYPGRPPDLKTKAQWRACYRRSASADFVPVDPCPSECRFCGNSS